MDCASFFETVADRLGSHAADPTETVVGDQCVVEFYHPRVVERLGTDSLVTRFNRSGLVWAPRGDRLGVKIRVTDPHRDAVTAALAAAPFSFEETDHRVVGAPDGEMVTILHYSVRTGPVSEADLHSTLDAVAAALAI
jgi:hypothetical protein